jgi:peptidyl-prolyl cis-trans isomerase C
MVRIFSDDARVASRARRSFPVLSVVSALALSSVFAGGSFASDPARDPDAPFTSPVQPPRPSGSVAEVPAGPVFGHNTGALTLTNPAELLNSFADTLDQHGSDIAAEVDGRPITKGEAADRIRAMPGTLASLGFDKLYRRALDELYRQKAMAIAADKAGLDKDPIVVRREKDAAERMLAEEWLSRAAAKAVTEQAVRARYDSEIAGKPGPEEVRARLILVPGESEARSIIDLVRGGADFAELAQRRSKDASAVAGGDLGYVRREALSPEVGTAVFALDPGQISPNPIKTQAGYFVVRVEGRRRAAAPGFEESRGQIAGALRLEAVVPLVRSVLATVNAQVLDPSLKPGVAGGQPPR